MKTTITLNYKYQKDLISSLDRNSIPNTAYEDYPYPTELHYIIPFNLYILLFGSEGIEEKDIHLLNKYADVVVMFRDNDLIEVIGFTIPYQPKQSIRIVMNLIGVLEDYGIPIINKEVFSNLYQNLIAGKRRSTRVDSLGYLDKMKYTHLKIIE